MRLFSLATAVLLGASCALAQAATPDAVIRKSLEQLQPGLTIESVSKSPMPGLYQVRLPGGRLLYASGDGEFLIQGHLFQVKDGKGLNLTQQAESQGVAEHINAIPREQMVIFAPDKPKAYITVFTDPDCGYCQKLHSEVPELNRQGIEVRYLAFPRQGPGSQGDTTLISIWCAKDRQQAMNKAKTRQPVPAATCENPVHQQFELGQLLGVNGTPSIVLANGQMIPGYQPADELARLALQAGESGSAAD